MFLSTFRFISHILRSIVSPNPEKVAATEKMPTPGYVVAPIFDSGAFSDTFEVLIDKLSIIDWRPGAPNRLEELEDCHVIQVEHYRMENDHRIPHEMIVLTVQKSTEGGIQVRYVRMERLKPDSLQPKNDESASKSKSRSSIDSFHFLKGGNSHDHVRVSAEKNILAGKHYKLVRSFNVLPGKFSILEAAVLGTTITTVAKNYSLLQHMCLWWASTFFLAARSIISTKLDEGSSPLVTFGAYRNSGGKFGNFRLVQKNGDLSLPDRQTTNPDTVIANIRDYLTDADIPSEEIEIAVQSLQEDLTRAQDDGHLTVKHVVYASRQLLESKSRAIQQEVFQAQEHNRTQAERDEREHQLRIQLELYKAERDELKTQKELKAQQGSRYY